MKFSWYRWYGRELIKSVADLMPTPPLYLLHSQHKWWNRKSVLLRLAGLNIGKNVVIDRNFFSPTLLEENIKIGDNSTVGRHFSCFAFGRINIGTFCMFAANVTLTNGGHERNSLQPIAGQLNIGNGCWIGHGATICGEVTVGDNAIIAAGAMVINDIPNSAIVAGVPAKIIGYRQLPEKVWHLGNSWFCPQNFQLIDK